MIYTFLGRKPKFGKDTYISETAIVIGDVVLGDNCYIGHGAIIRGDYGSIRVGSGTAVEEGVIIHCPPDEICTIGDKVTIGHGAIVHSHSIEDCAVIGMGAVLSLWSEIGEWAIVAEGAVVKMRQKVPKEVIVAGNPARVIRGVEPKDKEFWVYGKELYIDLAKKYKMFGIERVDL